MIWDHSEVRVSLRGLVGGLMLLITAAVLPAHADSLEDIFQKALQNDPQFQAAYYEHLSAAEIRTQAWSALRPTIGFSYDYSDTTQDIISSDNTVFASGSTTFTTDAYTLSLTQPIFRYASIVRLGQSKIEVQRADIQFDAALQDLIVRVSEKYLLALASQDQLTFAQAEQSADERHFELAKGRHEMGLSPITDLHDAKARLAAVKARTIEAEHMFDDSLQALREMTGDEVTDLVPLREDMELIIPEPAELERWVDVSLQQNLLLNGQRLAVRIAEKETSRQKAGHYPTLDLVGQFNNTTTEGTLFGGGSEVETTDLTLQLNVPIYEGGSVSSRTRQAASLHQRSLQDLEAGIRSVSRQARSAYLGVQSAINRVEALEQAVVSQKLTLEAKMEGFRAGLFTGLAVLDAERDLYQAKQAHALARYDYLLNTLRLRQGAGTLNAEDLTRAAKYFAVKE